MDLNLNDNGIDENYIANHFVIDFKTQDFSEWEDDMDGIMLVCVQEARKNDAKKVDALISYTEKVAGEESSFWQDHVQEAFIEALRPIILSEGTADINEIELAMLEAKTGEVCWFDAWEKAV